MDKSEHQDGFTAKIVKDDMQIQCAREKHPENGYDIYINAGFVSKTEGERVLKLILEAIKDIEFKSVYDRNLG